MRTFHLGGTATVVDQSFLEASYEGTVRIKNRNMLRNSDGNLIAMGRSMAIQILDEAGTERSSQRVAYGSKIYVDDGDTVKRGQRLAEWDPYTRPMMTEVEGTVEFEDVVDGISVLEADRRGNRHHQASGHRLAVDPAWRRSQAGDRDQGQGWRDRQAGPWR
jgi:DNA-directed RNA polymerase subunit beta'